MYRFCTLLVIMAVLPAGHCWERVRLKRQGKLSNMQQIVCARKPSLPFCPKTTTEAPTTTQAPQFDWGPTCAKFKEHFYYYCGNVKDHPEPEHNRLLKYCPLYARHCAVEDRMSTWFPEIPTTIEPCHWGCTKEHCTMECKCAYYWPGIDQRCNKGTGPFPMGTNECQGFFKNCEPFGYKFDVESHKQAVRDTAIKRGLAPPDPANKHNKAHHAQWWRGPTSSHVDWMHGGVRGGGDWGVPALGIGGTAAETGVAFPSVGQFLNIPNPHESVLSQTLGGRKRR